MTREESSILEYVMGRLADLIVEMVSDEQLVLEPLEPIFHESDFAPAVFAMNLHRSQWILREGPFITFPMPEGVKLPVGFWRRTPRCNRKGIGLRMREGR